MPLQDPLRQLADGSMTTLPVKHGIGTAPDGATGIGGGKQQSDHWSNGQIVEVIAHKGCLLGAHPQLVLQAREGSWLVFDSHKAMVDPQLPGTHLCRSSLTTTEKGNFKSRLLQQADPKPIAHIKALD